MVLNVNMLRYQNSFMKEKLPNKITLEVKSPIFDLLGAKVQTDTSRFGISQSSILLDLWKCTFWATRCIKPKLTFHTYVTINNLTVRKKGFTIGSILRGLQKGLQSLVGKKISASFWMWLLDCWRDLPGRSMINPPWWHKVYTSYNSGPVCVECVQ